MGEAIYYMKAKWPSPKAANEAAPKIEEFLIRMAEAEDRWQETRDGGAEAEASRRAEFPDVYSILHLERPTEGIFAGDYSNYCAYMLNSPYGKDYYDFEVEGDEIRFCGEVWHLADWDPLANALKETFGAISAGWISDEDEPDYYDLIELS